MWDMRAQQFFKNEEHYHRGMKLLQGYLAAASRCSSFEELSSLFLDDLDDTTDRESDLLDAAARLHTSRQMDGGHDPYAAQIAELAALIRSTANTRTQPEPLPYKVVSLSDAFEEFLSSQRGGWKVQGGMEKEYRDTFFPFMLEILGDIGTHEITKDHIGTLVKVLLVYPANKNKKAEYEYIAPLDFLNIDTPDEDRLKPITFNKYRTQIGSFLRWLKARDLSSIDLDAPLKTVRMRAARAADQRQAFTSDDLRKLFNSNDYRRGLHETASRFWVPLIALYTGARLNEICQLSTNDIRQDSDSGRWIFDFNENDDVPRKSLKRSHHARLVPINKKLITLGILEYAEHIKRTNTRLFPELEYVSDANKYGNSIQRWFNRTYKSSRCGVTTKKTSFHSLRHTVINHLATVHGVQENQVAAGLGQTATGGVYEVRYAKHHVFQAYAKYFDLINFDDCYDSRLIRSWRHHRFAKNC
jgi:integrase